MNLETPSGNSAIRSDESTMVTPSSDDEAQTDAGVTGSHSSARQGVRQLESTVAWLDNCHIEYVYLIVALVWGILLVGIMPPLQVPDEPAHFFRAWGLAEGALLPPRTATEYLPTNVWSLARDFPVGAIGDPSPYEGYEPGRVRELMGEGISGERSREVSSVPSQNPLAYLPQAGGVLIAKVTRFSPLGAFYLARLLNLLAAVALTFFAIRLLPFGKVILILVALFPVTVSEMASTSPDALTMGGAFLFLALALWSSDKSSLSNRDMLWLLVASVLLLHIKPAYSPLVGLILLLRPMQFPSGRRYAAWVAGIVSLAIVVTVVMVLVTPKGTADVAALAGPAPLGTDSVEQVKFIVGHPAAFVDAVFNTFGGAAFGYGYWMTGLLGWLTINVSQTAVVLIFGLILLFIGGSDEEPMVPMRDRAVLLLTWIAAMTAIVVSLYAGLNVVGGTAVNGIQGRYLTPVFPLLLLGVYRLRFKRRHSVVLILVVALALIGFWTMHAIWRHYYG